MLYSIAEAAKSTGVEESLFLSAIEVGQITGTKKVSGQCHINETELHSLYLSIAQDDCKRQWQAHIRRSDGSIPEPEITHDNDEGRVRQEQTVTRAGADQAETSPSTPATASTWQDGI